MSTLAQSPWERNVSGLSGTLVLAGLILGVLGTFAIAAPWISSIAFTSVAGWLLAASGVARLVRAFHDRHQPGLVYSVLLSIFTLCIGLSLATSPVRGVFALAWMLGFYLSVSGVLSVAWAFSLRPLPSTGWLFIHGIVNVLLGLIVLSGWPQSAVWVLGTLLGIDLIVGGVALISAGNAAIRLPSDPQPQ